jgi:hypothetical protein
MGGSGGGYSISSGDIENLRREVEERTRRSLVASEVNALLGEELSRINQRDVEKTNRYLDQIRDVLGEDVEAFDRLLFGGSVAKRTYVDGLSDIDSLVVLKNERLADLSPEQLRERVRAVLAERLEGDVAEVRTGTLAVTVVYRDGTEVQLLPALQRGERISISSADGTEWKEIQPRRFAEALTEVNQRQRGAVVPTVKLAKAIIANLPAHARLSGYHVEALAVAAFKTYSGSTTPVDMLTHFFESAATAVTAPVSDVTGQSRKIDSDLGERNSPERRRAASSLERVASTMKRDSAQDWRQLLEP